MSLKGSWVVDHRRMIVTLHTDRLRTLQHVREFLEGNQEVDLVVATRAAAYGFIEQTLGRFDYVHQGKAEKGLLRCFLAKVTGLSRAQLTRLLAQHRVTGSIADRRGAPRRPFPRRYTSIDIGLLAELDRLHGTLSGPATRKLCARAYHRFGDRRFDPVVVQNPLDRVPGDVVAEIRERATDARVPPRWILDRHPHHEVGHLAWRYRPASTSVGAAVVLPGNQPPVPAENRVGCDDAGDLRQNPPAEFLASHRESTALGVGQAKWTWATLLPEDPILLPKIIDHVFLVAVHPASGREYEEAQSVGQSLRLLGKQPLAPTWFRRFANLGRFVAPYDHP